MKIWNKSGLVFVIVVLLSGYQSVAAIKKPRKLFIDHNTGSSGSLNPTIPEPMIFDLVRPLGAVKGEIEVNTLVESRPGRQGETIRWAPELELVISNGFAFEFELPIHEIEIEDYKLAFQKTFGKDREKKFIHGWQTIGKYSHDDVNFNLTNLYITGYRFNQRWSALAMNGLKNNNIGKSLDLTPMSNISFFRHISPRLKLGIETNYAFHQVNTRARYNTLLVVPQLHYEIGKHYSVQLGTGLERYDDSRYAPMLAMRLVKEF